MGPSRGDTICGNVAIEALGPMHFGALALGPIHLARSPTEPKMWLATVERTLLPRSVDVSRFMAGVAELATRTTTGAVPIVLVDREADFCVVGYRMIEGARTLASIAEDGIDDDAAAMLARQLAQTLAELHRHGVVHGLITPTTIIHDGTRWWTWEYGIAGLCTPDRLAPRMRPLGGDVVAPELRAGAEMSPASDVYGWATAVACLLTGSVGSDAVAMLQDADASDPLRELVRACLDPIPELRPRDATALSERLVSVLAAPADQPASPTVSESSEFSFAELNEPTHAAARSDTHEIVELLSLGDEDENEDDASESLGTADTGEQWRALAEQYLSPAPSRTERTPPIAELEQVSAVDRRSVEALGRVALVRTRVRTGGQPPLSIEHYVVAGEFEMPEEPEPEPEPSAYPRSVEGAPELPLGTPEDEDWDDPDAAVFDLETPGAPRVEVAEHDIDPDPDPDPDLDPHALHLPTSPPTDGQVETWSESTPVDGLGTRKAVPERVLLEGDAVTADTESPATDGDTADAAASSDRALPIADTARNAEPLKPRVSFVETPTLSPARARLPENEPVPTVDRPASRPTPIHPHTTTTRERTGAAMGWTIALLAGVIAIGATLAAARERGGLSRLLGGGSAIVDRVQPSDPEAPRPPIATDVATAHVQCPAAMRPIEGVRACIDEAEAPGRSEVPLTRISLGDARAACDERGVRLCTPQQWRAACRGSRNWRHPYGPRGETDRCNGAAPSGAVQDLSRAGARDGCVTPTGVYDLEGNVGEWVDDGSVLGGDSTTRSPSCDSRAQPAAGSSSPSTGFRCCVELTESG